MVKNTFYKYWYKFETFYAKHYDFIDFIVENIDNIVDMYDLYVYYIQQLSYLQDIGFYIMLAHTITCLLLKTLLIRFYDHRGLCNCN